MNKHNDKAKPKVLAVNLVTNGDFSQGAEGWQPLTVEDGPVKVESNHLVIGDGSRSAQQNIKNLVAGQKYSLTFSYKMLWGGNAGYAQVVVNGGGVQAFKVFTKQDVMTPIDPLVFTSEATGDANLSFQLSDELREPVVEIDDVEFKWIPTGSYMTTSENPTSAAGSIVCTLHALSAKGEPLANEPVGWSQYNFVEIVSSETITNAQGIATCTVKGAPSSPTDPAGGHVTAIFNNLSLVSPNLAFLAPTLSRKK